MLYCIYSGNMDALSGIDRHCMEKTNEFIDMNYLSQDESGKLNCEVPVILVKERWEFYKLCDKYSREVAEKFHAEISELMRQPMKLPKHVKSVPNWQRYMWCHIAFHVAVLLKAKDSGLLLKGVQMPAPAVLLAIEKGE